MWEKGEKCPRGDPPQIQLAISTYCHLQRAANSCGKFQGMSIMWGAGEVICTFGQPKQKSNQRGRPNLRTKVTRLAKAPTTPHQECTQSHYPPISHKEQHTLCGGCMFLMCMLVVCHCMGTHLEQGMWNTKKQPNNHKEQPLPSPVTSFLPTALR